MKTFSSFSYFSLSEVSKKFLNYYKINKTTLHPSTPK